jgi:hypothetical protein
MAITNALAQQICAIQNQMVPNEGPKTIPMELQFDTTDTLVLNGLGIQQLGKISIIQTLYVDTSGGAALTIVCGQSRQRIDVPANTQGYYNVLLPGTFEITFVSTIGSVVNVQLINVPIAGAVWSTT